MKKYILFSNRQKDIEYQYADFSYNAEMGAVYFDYSKFRIKLMNLINKLGLKNTKINYFLILRHIFKQTIEQQFDYDSKNEYVFIIMARVYEKYGSYLTKYLRDRYPSCVLVVYIVDLLHNMRFSLEEAKKDFDLVCSFDEEEAKSNNLGFVLEPFSTRLLSDLQENDIKEYDVSFVGAAKGRLNKIMLLYNQLTNKGLKCDFYIVGVDKKDQIQAEGIHYHWLDFAGVLEHAAKSRCLVELMQKGGYSATTRFAEAVLLNKNLITDCPALKHSYEETITFLDDSVDLSVNQICDTHNWDREKYVELLSNKSFIRTIEKHLTKIGL